MVTIAIINCESNQDCFLTYEQSNKCINNTIICPTNYLCNISCNLDSCQNIVINASQSSSLHLHITNLWESELTIYSPSSKSNSKSNSDIDIHHEPVTHIYDKIRVVELSKHGSHQNHNHHVNIEPLRIYSLNGFSDIVINTENNLVQSQMDMDYKQHNVMSMKEDTLKYPNQQHTNGIMHCGKEYISSCQFSSRSGSSCIVGEHQCNQKMLSATSTLR